MTTLGVQLVEWLEAYGVDTVFGIPGVHTVEMYRGLADSSIRHLTPRHEQGAGFMADGYARVTGKPGVAFVITGPGLTNILTPMAQAYADSVPMLVISSVNRREVAGMGGDLHEVRNQGLMAAQAAAFSHTLTHPNQLPGVLARAWAVFNSARPRPVHIQMPLDMFAEPPLDVPIQVNAGRFAKVPDLSDAMEHLQAAKRPLILAGGGAKTSGIADLSALLDAPVVTTVNARGCGGPLEVPASPSLTAVRSLISDADVVLAIGTEIGRTDFDMYDRGGFEIPGTLIRVDIDAEQLFRGAAPDMPIQCDAADAVAGLRNAATGQANRGGADRAASARDAAWQELGPKYRKIVSFLDSIHGVLPGAPIVCDSTQAAYAGNLYFGAKNPGLWFNASTGYGALGYGLPAAIGAARGLGAPVVCIAGDGGLQFTLADLGTAVEESLPVILLVWNNQGYGEIKDYMVGRQIKPVGVDLHTPDFVALGKAYGIESMALQDVANLPELLAQAAARKGPTLIEIDEALVLT